MSDELIYKAIPAIMAEIGAIGKNSKNMQQHYNFRGIDEVYNVIQPLLVKHGVFTAPEVLEDRHEERQSKSGGTLIYRVLKMKYTFYAADGSHVDTVVMGEGMDSGDKASNKAMAVAHKYAMLQMFAVPTDEPKDPEIDSPDAGKPVVTTRVETVTPNPEWQKAKMALLTFMDANITFFNPEDVEKVKRGLDKLTLARIREVHKHMAEVKATLEKADKEASQEPDDKADEVEEDLF